MPRFKSGGFRAIPNTDGSTVNPLELADKDNLRDISLQSPDTLVADVDYTLPGVLATPGAALIDPLGNGILAWGVPGIAGGGGPGAGTGAWIIEPLKGVKDGNNRDFYTTYVPIYPPTGTPPMVPFDAVSNRCSLSPYIPNYLLAPGSNHLIMIVAPLQTDDLWCRYFAGAAPAGPGGPGGGPGPVPPGGTSVLIRGSSTQTSTSGTTTVTWPASPAPAVAGDTVFIFVGEGAATSVTPAGWTRINPTGAGSWDELCIYHVLTAADIAVGSIVITW